MTEASLTEMVTKTLRRRADVLTRLEAEVLARDIVYDLIAEFGPVDMWADAGAG